MPVLPLALPLPRRQLKAKELAALLGIDGRHLRRLQRSGQVVPLKRPGSCRIVGYALEEVARIVVTRVKAGKGFDREVAQEFGYLSFLDAVASAAESERMQASPARFGEMRLELMADLLVFGHESTLAKTMGLTAVEVDSYATMAANTVGQLFRELPQVRQAVARQLQAGLVSLAVQRGQAQANAKRPKQFVSPVACGTTGGDSREAPPIQQTYARDADRPARPADAPPFNKP